MALAEVRRGPGLKDRNFSDTAGIKKHKLDPSYRFMYDDFKAVPLVQLAGGGAATGGDTEESFFQTDCGVYSNTAVAAQAIISPVINAAGLDVAGDQVNDNGRIIHFGCGTNNASDRMAFTIGTDAFFVKLKFSIATVAGTDDCAVGFHKRQASVAAAIDNYTDFAVLNVISGSIYTEYAVNNAATTTSSALATWADAETHTLEIRVDSYGQASAFVDGYLKSANFMKFDSADVVVPFFYLLQANASQTGTVIFQELTCGLQEANVR